MASHLTFVLRSDLYDDYNGLHHGINTPRVSVACNANQAVLDCKKTEKSITTPPVQIHLANNFSYDFKSGVSLLS